MALGGVLSFGADEHGPEKSVLELENAVLIEAVEQDPELARKFYCDECKNALKSAIIFCGLDDEHLEILSSVALRRRYGRGDVIVTHGEPHKWCYVIAEGEIQRTRFENGRLVGIDTHEFQNTLGTLGVLTEEPATATATCLTDVVVYALPSEQLRECLRSSPSLALQIADSLCARIKAKTKATTPLLAPRRDSFSFVAAATAASVDAACRSSMSAYISFAMTGRRASVLPALYWQVPGRVAYVAAIKGLRSHFDSLAPPNESLWNRFMLACAPGLIVTPLSGAIEAANAGSFNPEPMLTRSVRGTVPRAGREVIFAVGLNQASDYFEERLPLGNKVAEASVAGAAAGFLAAWTSSLLHSLAVRKLLHPRVPYSALWARQRHQAEESLPKELHPQLRSRLGFCAAAVFPQGLLVRCAQTALSFAMINGGIVAVKDVAPW
eukprot:TRINITY_DN9517_c0_g1_i3.p1 TRINITY_DN9517_c0_g1~~TRINITY_DN9517_c0_g1_i3.p1  ORF type:complete len:439 (+),score=76.74 TRINITY_DN9517_c0_g1_i3:97-1413(+)